MVRGTMTTRRIGSPSAGLSGAAVESGCWAAAVVSGRWAAAVESGPAAGAARSTLAAKPLARTLAPPRRAQSLTRQLGFTGERKALDEVLEGLLGLGGLAQLLLAQRQLVERRGNLVPLGVGGLHLRVLHRRAVELRLCEQTFSDAVLGVVRELERGEARDEVPESLQRERVPPLRQVLGRLSFQEDVGAAVLLPGALVVAGIEGTFLAVRDHLESRRGDPGRHQVVASRLGALLAERLVVLGRAALVTVSLDDDAGVRVVA